MFLRQLASTRTHTPKQLHKRYLWVLSASQHGWAEKCEHLSVRRETPTSYVVRPPTRTFPYRIFWLAYHRKLLNGFSVSHMSIWTKNETFMKDLWRVDEISRNGSHQIYIGLNGKMTLTHGHLQNISQNSAKKTFDWLVRKLGKYSS